MRRRWLGVRSDSTPRQNGASARVQQLPAAAEMIRASVKNRVDNHADEPEPSAGSPDEPPRPARSSDAALRTNAKRS